MFSELDYSKFEKKVLNRAKEIAQEKVYSASSYAEKRLIDAEKEGRKIYEEIVTGAKIEAESLRSSQLTEIDVEFKKQIEKKEVYIRQKLMEFLKEKLEKEFPDMVFCFLTWLKENFKDGEVFVNPQIYTAVKSKLGDSFKIIKSDEQEGILFKSGRIFIEFSPNTILEEFKEIIDAEIGKILEV